MIGRQSAEESRGTFDNALASGSAAADARQCCHSSIPEPHESNLELPEGSGREDDVYRAVMEEKNLNIGVAVRPKNAKETINGQMPVLAKSPLIVSGEKTCALRLFESANTLHNKSSVNVTFDPQKGVWIGEAPMIFTKRPRAAPNDGLRGVRVGEALKPGPVQFSLDDSDGSQMSEHEFLDCFHEHFDENWTQPSESYRTKNDNNTKRKKARVCFQMIPARGPQTKFSCDGKILEYRLLAAELGKSRQV